MKRRTMLYGGVAALAGLAGAGAAWWKFQPKNAAPAEIAKITESYLSVISFDDCQCKPFHTSSHQ